MTLTPDTTPSDRSSQLSPNTPGPSTQWPAPRAPLPPHRLAKLANALGISAPVPHSHIYNLSPNSPHSVPNSSAASSFPDLVRRSPTPSATSAQTHTPSSSSYSRYLLHVLPPEHLPHEFTDYDDLSLAPPSASGYHTQFRRGVMVPVYPTLQTQMGAIAREYALPSTLGMVLYLVTSTPGADDEPGPRISEDIWKHIWTRVLRAEKEELTPSGPRPLGLGFSVPGQSSPGLLQDIAANGHQLKSIIPSPVRADTSQSVTPSPSTPSNSAYSSQSELETPESASSVAASGDLDAGALTLPGLSSPSLIPILAKVEFDIDRRKAGWYDRWVRSRKVQHAKRAESRAEMRSRSRMGSQSEVGDGVEEESQAGSRRAPIDLELLGRINADGSSVPSFLLTRDKQAEDVGADEDAVVEADYEQLADSPVEEAEEDVTSGNGDPLADVFGTDAETWAEVHAESQVQRASLRNSNPNAVDLALDAAALSSLPDDLEEDDEGDESDAEGEVTQLLNAMNRPSLSLDIPSSLPSDFDPSTATAETIKRHVPPPLKLDTTESLAPPQASPNPDEDLPYLGLPTPSDAGDVMSREEAPIEIDVEMDDLFKNSKSPQEEKREGAIFDDLNLGLDPSLDDFDLNDPYDRRRSQYIMSAQLDEIEKTLAQLSPRLLHAEIAADDSPLASASSFSSFPPERAASASPRPPPQRTSTQSSTGGVPSWPAVPYSKLNSSQRDEDAPPSPPKFAFNGITTEAPKSFQQRNPTEGVSSESLARKRALEEEHGLYPALTTGVPHGSFSDESPIIPLSPDPFGRFPSQGEADYMEDTRQSQVSLDTEQQQLQANRGSTLTVSSERERPVSQTPSSRFSIDSVTSEEANQQRIQKTSSSLMSVKSISRLWRKSGTKGSISNPPLPTESGRSSPNTLAPPPAQAPPPQPAQSGRRRSKSVSKQAPAPLLPPSPAPPSPMPPPQSAPIPTALQVPQSRPVYRQLHFNQDSPYPVHPIGRSPPAPSPRELSPPVSAVPLNPSPQPSSRPPSISGPDRSSGARKSILKSWRSSTGLHGSKSSISRPPSSSGTPRSSNEQSSETTRKRRPSVLDIATSVMRNSMASSTTLNGSISEIPPSPAIPEQFASQMSSSRSGSRQSLATLNSVDHKGRPSVSSSSASSPPRVRSPLTAASPPRSGNGYALRKSIDSGESRPSLDVSQFEMVSPKKDAYMLESTLSYPYHSLDHSMTSHE
ncbi:hypothetical protein EIP91_006615 [Steccherinum ochraceum]|uniref:Uncharacterized protein n=1 Tax=Steccherinum ochraceum TaxID=92696 RepID=A0A4R0R5E9_9APHY|nr:hypothetical protein EIP91_006615 [Steccherinum ochraceum]